MIEQNLKRIQNLEIDATKDKIKQSHEEEHKDLRVQIWIESYSR